MDFLKVEIKPSVVLVLGHRSRRWPNIKTTMGKGGHQERLTQSYTFASWHWFPLQNKTMHGVPNLNALANVLFSAFERSFCF